MLCCTRYFEPGLGPFFFLDVDAGIIDESSSGLLLKIDVDAAAIESSGTIFLFLFPFVVVVVVFFLISCSCLVFEKSLKYGRGK